MNTQSYIYYSVVRRFTSFTKTFIKLIIKKISINSKKWLTIKNSLKIY